MRHFLFTLFLQIPGTILNIGGILVYLIIVCALVLQEPGQMLRFGLYAAEALLVFFIGRTMILGSELLSGRLTLPDRKDLFLLTSGLEMLSQALCTAAGGIVIAGIMRAMNGEFGDLPAFGITAASLLVATFVVHLFFRRTRERIKTDTAGTSETVD